MNFQAVENNQKKLCRWKVSVKLKIWFIQTRTVAGVPSKGVDNDRDKSMNVETAAGSALKLDSKVDNVVK